MAASGPGDAAADPGLAPRVQSAGKETSHDVNSDKIDRRPLSLSIASPISGKLRFMIQVQTTKLEELGRGVNSTKKAFVGRINRLHRLMIKFFGIPSWESSLKNEEAF